MPRKVTTVEAIQEKLKRWTARARRASNAIDRLQKQMRALERRATLPHRKDNAAPAAPTTIASAPSEVVMPASVIEPQEQIESALDIPACFKRSGGESPKPPPGKSLDPVAAEIKREQEERKAAKARGRSAKAKAKKAGDLKKMPLSGKAALAEIMRTDK